MSNHVYIIPLLLLFVNNYFIISNIIFLINMHELNFLQIFKAPAPYVQMNHPRACGEKRYITTFKPYLKGSPPRMRGKVLTRLTQFDDDGITPAHAGKRQVERGVPTIG